MSSFHLWNSFHLFSTWSSRLLGNKYLSVRWRNGETWKTGEESGSGRRRCAHHAGTSMIPLLLPMLSAPLFCILSLPSLLRSFFHSSFLLPPSFIFSSLPTSSHPFCSIFFFPAPAFPYFVFFCFKFSILTFPSHTVSVSLLVLSI